MFQNRQQPTFGNINVGNLSVVPSLEDVRFLLEQASRYGGRFVEVRWTVPKTGLAFQLTAKVILSQSTPAWMLYRSISDSSQLVWGHNCSDLTLIHNLIMLECEKPADGGFGDSAAADALDAPQGANLAPGSAIGTLTDQARLKAVSQGNGSGIDKAVQQFSAAKTAGATQDSSSGQHYSGTDPATLWLRNLNVVDTPEPGAHGFGLNTGLKGPTKSAPLADKVPRSKTEPEVVEAAEFLVSDISLEGSITNIPIFSLLRYLENNQCSGRLTVQSSYGAAEIFFQNGELRHAATLDSKGENALYDTATWYDGEFNFHADDHTRQHTLAYETGVLIARCQRMSQYHSFLRDAGLSSSSYLIPEGDRLSRADFESLLSKRGVPGDETQQWRVYELSTGHRTLADVLKSCPMSRAEWIPMLYNLINLNLLSLSTRPLKSTPGMFLECVQIDQDAIDKFMSAATYPADGLLAKGLFLWLLQQEAYRFERTGARYALVLFNLSSADTMDGGITLLEKPVFAEAARRILASKRRLDAVGHFDDEYALLLPETDSAGAAVFVNRILQLLKKPVLMPEFDAGKSKLAASFGVASIPDDVRELGTLISAARVAKKKSALMGSPLVLFSESS